jgi:monoamine oxidase
VTTDSCDVAIIGAGAAGLAAAAALAGSKRSVLVLEARDRIGGRIWTRHESGLPVPIELGAEFIHGDAPETMAHLRRANAAAIESPDEHVSFHDGDVQPTEGFTQVQKAIRESRALLDERDLSLDEFLDKHLARVLSVEARQYARMMAEGFDAADPSRVSARSLVEEWTSEAMTHEPQSRPDGGYDSLLRELAGAARRGNVRLQLQTIVRGVKWSGGSVQIEAQARGEPLRVSARRAIVTLPLGVLQASADAPGGVRFSPPLDSKRAALEGLGFGPVVKLNLRFRTAFWDEIEHGRYRDVTFFHSRKAPFPTFWSAVPLRAPLLVAWAGGPRATRLAGASTGELAKLAVTTLQSMFGETCDVQSLFEAAYWHDWQQDPHSRGAYSYVRVGGGDASRQLAAPLADTLFFAGEATDHEGESTTVTGALRSGERAAREVLQDG